MELVCAHSVSLAFSFTSWFPHPLWTLTGFHSPLISRLFLIPVFMNVSETHSVMENVDGRLTLVFSSLWVTTDWDSLAGSLHSFSCTGILNVERHKSTRNSHLHLSPSTRITQLQGRPPQGLHRLLPEMLCSRVATRVWIQVPTISTSLVNVSYVYRYRRTIALRCPNFGHTIPLPLSSGRTNYLLGRSQHRWISVSISAG